ncbi:LamG-like jellyroll fold domain-containing protein [Saccharothrix saharensis]|uniref:LamG-like jellyroll fold domain-containing protein n=1 Tax=Saccharothrix saharensis TaxID=571190 RepID=UPI00147814ED|nr:LamG-like jellyroll fold domain-containing protein [Saccharothrix saharensis]
MLVGTAAALVGTATALWQFDREGAVGVVPAAQGPVAEAETEQAALAAARRQGSKVEVAGLKTENARFFANPGGSMTMEQSVVATRLKRDGTWVDIDPSLVERGDGSFATRATEAEVVFSGGGAQRFARMTAGGAEIALSWPTPLPEPVISGDTATYPEVIPGVDLRARAGREGFGHELVVKTRGAAAALTEVRFGLTVEGARFSEDKGALKAVNPKGEVVFSAPAATMWDSGGRDAAVGVAVSATELALTPDRALLTDPAAELPITIDPQYSYHSPRQAEWSVVRSGWPDQAYHNPAPVDADERAKGVARVGKCPDCDRADIARSLFRFDAVPLQGTKIQSARLFIKQGWKYQHTCDSAQVPWVDLHVLNHVGWDTTWHNQPWWGDANRVDSARPVGKVGYCTPGWASFVIWTPAQEGADGNWRNLVFGLKDRDETSENGWKRFYVAREDDGTESYPYISVEYNHHPDNARNPRTEPVLTPCKHCGGTSYVGGDRILLKGDLSDPDGGTIWGGVHVNGVWQTMGTGRSGTTFATEVGLAGRPDGQRIDWNIAASDGVLDSKVWENGPSFVIDRTPPKPPIVDSVLYREDNDWHGGPGVADRFWFRSNGDGDVDHYKYSWSGTPSERVELDQGSTLGGSSSTWLTPRDTGRQTLFVSSVDKAGNTSPPTTYTFNVRTGLGPKSLWPLDGHARDDADVGDRDATLHGGATWIDGGAVGSAVQLDGVNGYLSAPNSVLTGTSFSASAWVKLDPQHPGSTATAVSQLGSALPGFQLSWLNTNSWAFGVARSATDVANDVASSPVGAPQPGAWTHLTGVYDATVRTLRLYVNGTLVGTAQRSTNDWSAAGEVRIGDAGSAGQRWKGAVDEVRVYDRALVGSEVRALVGLGNVQAGQWKFDDRTGGNNVPGGTPMTLKGGAKYVPGAVGEGLQLDGVDDTAETGESVLRTDQSFAVTAWVKQDRTGPDGRAYSILSQDAGPRSGFALNQRQVNGVGRWELLAPSSQDTPGSPNAQALSSMPSKPNTWTHLAGVFDRPAQQIRLYVDGVHAATAPWTSHTASSGSLMVGTVRWNGNLNGYWPGGVDEVRAYTRVIDEAEIRGIIAADAVATGSWKLDGNAVDDSGRGRDGTVSGTPTWVPGHSTTPNADDLAVGLDGVDDRIHAPNAVDTTRSYAVSAWLNPRAANVVQTAVSQDGAAAGTPAERSGFALHTTADGRWAFTGVTATGAPVSVTGGGVQPGAWTHLAGVHDAQREEISLYVNGVVVGTRPLDAPLGSGKELQIGRGQAAGKAVEFFRGAVDDVRTYQRTLFEEEIRVIAGRDLALVHNLKLDETGGTTAADSVGSRGGTVHGGATFGPGRGPGNGVALDGVDDAVSTTGTDVRTDQSFTVSTWVNLREAVDGEVTAVSLDSGQAGKFRLGHVKDDYENSLGAWTFEMPEQDGTVTQAALSVLPTEVGEDKWAHLVGVYDAKAKKIWLYVNGLRVGDGTLLTPWAGGEGLQLGRSKHDNTYSRYWAGRIDDVRLYTGALSTDRVWELHKSYGSA